MKRLLQLLLFITLLSGSVAVLAYAGLPYLPSRLTALSLNSYLYVEPGQADFDAEPTSGMAPLAVTFNNKSLGKFSASLWDFGDGQTSTLFDPEHTYTSSGAYTVTLTISGLSGTDTLTKTNYLNVYTAPAADFSAEPTTGVKSLPVTFSNLSTGSYTTCAWDFGDGSGSPLCAPQHTYNTSGVYSVTLTVSGPAGEDTLTKANYITVDEPVTALFTAEPISGTNPLEVSFTNASTGDYDFCSWDFGDSTSSAACHGIIHTYTSAGSFTVTLTVSSTFDVDSLTKANYLTVYTKPAAEFSASPLSGLRPLNVTFTDLSTGDYDACDWDFGDGTGSSNCAPQHVYDAKGVYSVTLTVSGPAGVDTLTKASYITVYEPATALFTATPISGTNPLEVSFTNASTGDYDFCHWDFGDSISSAACHGIIHTYTSAGSFTVTLTVSTTFDVDSLTKANYITVYTKPAADFSASPLSGLRPLTVSYTDLSTGDYDTCAWDFGDGTSSSNCAPQHAYDAKGVYSVTLTVSGPAGEDTLIKTNYITVYEPATALFTATPISGTNPLEVSFTNDSTGDYDFCVWDFGDFISRHSCQDGLHTYTSAGSFTVTLTVSSTFDIDSLTRPNYITVYTKPEAKFSASPLSGLRPMNVTFTDLSTGDYDTCAWDFGDSNSSSHCDPQHTYIEGGHYTVTLTVSGPAGSDTEIKQQLIDVEDTRIYLPLVIKANQNANAIFLLPGLVGLFPILDHTLFYNSQSGP